jgi:hypothetical protein
MYSPKIREDLIPIIYKKSKLVEKTMTKIVDDILRTELIDNNDEDTIYKCCSCNMQVDVVDGETGFCDHCESIVFIEKA